MKKLLWIPLLFLSVRGWATNGYIQFATCDQENANSIQCTFASNVKAGDTIVIGCTIGSNGINISTDSVGDTFHYVGSTITVESRNINMMYATNVAGGATNVTCASSPGNSTIQAIVAEYASSTTSGGFDVTSSSAAAALANVTAFTSNSATTSQANETMVSYCGYLNSASAVSSVNGTLREQSNNDNLVMLQDANVATASSYASTGVANANLTLGAGCIQASFKAPPTGLGTLIIE